jgi:hypothetical protein
MGIHDLCVLDELLNIQKNTQYWTVCSIDCGTTNKKIQTISHQRVARYGTMIRGNALVNAAARGLRRSWSHCSGRSTGRSSSSSSSDDYGNPPVVELREYTLLPGGAERYMELAEKSAPLRKSMLPLRFFGLPQTGGTLNVATHMYFYKGAVYVVVGVVVDFPLLSRCPTAPRLASHNAALPSHQGV